MTAKTTLNAKNLEALGTQRLAELLIEISTGSAASKRRLRLELAGNRGSSEVAHEVRKRLASIARSKTFINWRRVKAVRSDLDTQRSTIVDVVAATDPEEAFELIWQFLAIANTVLERTSETGASLIEVFHQACLDAGSIAKLADVRPNVLAEKILMALQTNEVGQYDRLIDAMRPALGSVGLQSLRELLIAWRDEPSEAAIAGRQTTAKNRMATVHGEEPLDRFRQRAARAALQQIADAEGDVDAYIAQFPLEARSGQAAAVSIARRLRDAGRPDDALIVLEKADQGAKPETLLQWQLVRLDVLEVLGRGDEAQVDRWTWFERSLQEQHLRAHLRHLPDFDDVEAEESAFRIARAFPDVQRALAFFIAWPALAQAARLVVDRRRELDGDDYDLLSRAAEALAAKYPVSATILLRTMIDFTLDRARSSRYKHGARHLAECAGMAHQLADLHGLDPHQVYVVTLRQRHGKKNGFWKHVRP